MQERKGGRQSQPDTTVLLVSLNLSKVLCQVRPVHSCINFSSLKVTQKTGNYREKGIRERGQGGQNKKGKQYNLFEKCQKWKMEKMEKKC